METRRRDVKFRKTERDEKPNRTEHERLAQARRRAQAARDEANKLLRRALPERKP